MGQRKLLLMSCTEGVIGKISFAFPKPTVELKTLCIPTAANLEKGAAWLKEEKQALVDGGFKLVDFDIEGKSPHEVGAKLSGADVLYVTGGNTYYLLAQMKKCGFALSVGKFLDRGGIYLGVSAGAVVAGPSVDFIGDLDDRAVVHLDDYTGLSLTNCKILPHTDNPHYGNKIRKIISKIASTEAVIGLRDDQAAYIRGDFVEVY